MMRRHARAFLAAVAATLARRSSPRARLLARSVDVLAGSRTRSSRVRLMVGQKFRGEPIPRTAALIEKFVLVTSDGEAPVPGREGGDPAGLVRVARPGLADRRLPQPQQRRDARGREVREVPARRGPRRGGRGPAPARRDGQAGARALRALRQGAPRSSGGAGAPEGPVPAPIGRSGSPSSSSPRRTRISRRRDSRCRSGCCTRDGRWRARWSSLSRTMRPTPRSRSARTRPGGRRSTSREGGNGW